MPETTVVNNVVGDRLTVSWPRAENSNFLGGYHVFFTFTSLVTQSAHRRRQITSPVRVDPDQTSADIDFQPFSMYNVSVSAVYNPPSGPSEVLVALLPTATFMTPERGKSHVLCRVQSLLN